MDVGGERESWEAVERKTEAGGECCSRRDGWEAVEREVVVGGVVDVGGEQDGWEAIEQEAWLMVNVGGEWRLFNRLPASGGWWGGECGERTGWLAVQQLNGRRRLVVNVV